MPITINGKTYLNLQEAVAWLLANNALPFQSTASFVANTEIAKTTIINPSPAEIKIGSLVLFADGKVGTVSGVTANGFMVGTDATDLSDGVPHIVGITLDPSSHLIFTMSEGNPIDAGLVKEVSTFTIDASQHLIVNYNDGTTQDLGLIFNGNVNLSGTLTATRVYGVKMEDIKDISGNSRFIEGDINLEPGAPVGATKTYGKWSLSGTHLMFVLVLSLANATVLTNGDIMATAVIPTWLHDKIFKLWSTNAIDRKDFAAWSDTWNTQQVNVIISKESGNRIRFINGSNLTLTDDRNVRIQFDLLIDNA